MQMLWLSRAFLGRQVCTEETRELGVDTHVCELLLLLREMYELKVRRRGRGGGAPNVRKAPWRSRLPCCWGGQMTPMLMIGRMALVL